MISYHFHNRSVLILRFAVLPAGKAETTVSSMIWIATGPGLWSYNNTNIKILILNHAYYKPKYSGFLKIPAHLISTHMGRIKHWSAWWFALLDFKSRQENLFFNNLWSISKMRESIQSSFLWKAIINNFRITSLYAKIGGGGMLLAETCPMAVLLLAALKIIFQYRPGSGVGFLLITMILLSEACARTLGFYLSRRMDICLRFFCVCVALCKNRPHEGPIPHPRSPIRCL
jgi:hypothetical protein